VTPEEVARLFERLSRIEQQQAEILKLVRRQPAARKGDAPMPYAPPKTMIGADGKKYTWQGDGIGWVPEW